MKNWRIFSSILTLLLIVSTLNTSAIPNSNPEQTVFQIERTMFGGALSSDDSNPSLVRIYHFNAKPVLYPLSMDGTLDLFIDDMDVTSEINMLIYYTATITKTNGQTKLANFFFNKTLEANSRNTFTGITIDYTHTEGIVLENQTTLWVPSYTFFNQYDLNATISAEFSIYFQASNHSLEWWQQVDGITLAGNFTYLEDLSFYNYLDGRLETETGSRTSSSPVFLSTLLIILPFSILKKKQRKN